jgi:thiol-disulfide isomerase/thioredoxin
VFAGATLWGAGARAQGQEPAPAQAPQFAQAPELAKGEWVGTPTTIAANRGKVIVLTFWAYQCINCKRTLPYWNQWAKRYAGAEGKPGDVVVIAVQTPETPDERVFANVKAASEKHKLVFPTVTDNDYKTWKAYNVQMWPTTILIDKQGKIRGRWQGELNWQSSGEFNRVLAGIELLRKEKP